MSRNLLIKKTPEFESFYQTQKNRKMTAISRSANYGFETLSQPVEKLNSAANDILSCDTSLQILDESCDSPADFFLAFNSKHSFSPTNPFINKLPSGESGFEPAVRFDPNTALAMLRIRPLCHLSGRDVVTSPTKWIIADSRRNARVSTVPSARLTHSDFIGFTVSETSLKSVVDLMGFLASTDRSPHIFAR
jgi:hypothetical protein